MLKVSVSWMFSLHVHSPFLRNGHFLIISHAESNVVFVWCWELFPNLDDCTCRNHSPDGSSKIPMRPVCELSVCSIPVRPVWFKKKQWRQCKFSLSLFLHMKQFITTTPTRVMGEKKHSGKQHLDNDELIFLFVITIFLHISGQVSFGHTCTLQF